MTEPDTTLRDKYKMEVNEDDDPLLSDAYIDYVITKNTVDTVLNHSQILYELYMRKHLKLSVLSTDGVSENRDMNAYLNLALMVMPRQTSATHPEEFTPADYYLDKFLYRHFNTGEEI